MEWLPSPDKKPRSSDSNAGSCLEEPLTLTWLAVLAQDWVCEGCLINGTLDCKLPEPMPSG